MKIEKFVLAAFMLSTLGGGSLQAIKVSYSGPGLIKIEEKYEGYITLRLKPAGYRYWPQPIDLKNPALAVTALEDLTPDPTQTAIVGPSFIINTSGGANNIAYCSYNGEKGTQDTTIPLSGIKSLHFTLTMTPQFKRGEFTTYLHTCALTTE